MAIAMHTATILTAIQTILTNASLGISTYAEGFPDTFPADTSLPACYFLVNDFTDTPENMVESFYQQTYEVFIYLVCRQEGATFTRTYGRNKAEAARNALKTTPALGLGQSYRSHPTRLTLENDLEQFFRVEKQPRQCFMIRLIVTKDEDES